MELADVAVAGGASTSIRMSELSGWALSSSGGGLKSIGVSLLELSPSFHIVGTDAIGPRGRERRVVRRGRLGSGRRGGIWRLRIRRSRIGRSGVLRPHGDAACEQMTTIKSQLRIEIILPPACFTGACSLKYAQTWLARKACRHLRAVSNSGTGFPLVRRGNTRRRQRSRRPRRCPSNRPSLPRTGFCSRRPGPATSLYNGWSECVPGWLGSRRQGRSRLPGKCRRPIAASQKASCSWR